MNDELAQAKAKLQQLLDSDILDEAEYRTMLNALEAQHGQGAARSVTAQTIHGPVATGEQARQVEAKTYIERQYNQLQPPDLATPALVRYLDTFCKRCNILPLGVIGGDEETSEDVRLDQVYIALDTQTRVPLTAEEKAQRATSAGLGQRAEDRPLAALEAVQQHRRLVLLGDPGSGKSTFVRQLAAQRAQAVLRQEEPPSVGPTTPLPLLVALHELTPALTAVELEGIAADEQRHRLVEAVRQQWLAQLTAARAADFADGLADALAAGDVLLVFDGLDEVAADLRTHMRQAVRAICQSYPEIQQVIITCRIRSYVGAAVFTEFVPHTLAPFDAKKIKQFIQAWYGAQVALQRMDQAKGQAAAADLQQAVRDVQLHELAENPLLLTTMAIIHQREIGLPREKVRLYALAVQVLLSRWQMRKGFTGPTQFSAQLTALLKADLTLRSILERLAYRAHQQQAQGASEAALTRGDLLALLEEPDYLGSAALAAEFLDYIDQRAGLLVGRGGSDAKADGTSRQPQLYSFPHRTFQEYLAGCQMVQGRSRAREYWRRVREGDFWYLAAQLGAEELLYNRGNDAEMLLDLAYDLCPTFPLTQEHEWRALLWSGHMAGLLGVETIRRDRAKPDSGAVYLARLIPGLVGILCQSSLKAIERSDAGRILAVLGDPRRAVLDPLQIEFCDIPAGPFLMGRADPDARDYEQPQQPYASPYAYKIARFPVTNAQFQHFVEADGYTNPAYWSEAITHGRWQDGKVKGYMWDLQQEKVVERFADAPADYGQPFTLPNYPVVGVNWYEALAFTRWLTEQMHECGTLPQDWAIRLPSEAEWEKAARGTDGRIYPWGNTPDPNAANYEATGINTTSALGCFPAGASPYRVEELVGNVWEWTRSLWGDDVQKPDFGYPYDPTDGREDLKASDRVLRVLRGGAYYSKAGGVGCGARHRGFPHGDSYEVGFRIVASPSTSGN